MRGGLLQQIRGDDFCGDGCQGSCDAKPECGEGSPTPDCPLNVCCSKFGFCGTTSEFCDANSCQGENCGMPNRPQCPENTNALDLPRRVGYYEAFALSNRLCDKFLPEHIAAGALTHVNIAFEVVGGDFRITDEQGEIVTRVVALKRRFKSLRVNIAVGGWAFNDPPTQTLFSDMATHATNRETFIDSVVDHLTKYGLDGIDIDWEYPVAEDRGGVPEDQAAFAQLIYEMKERFGRENPGWEVSLTLPSSYWYMRGFDLVGLQQHVDYFNFMSYDLHGMWDQHNKYTGPYLKGHTNLTEISQGLDLLWRNGVDPAKVVMGFGFYGRSFTMQSPSCHDPEAGCQFSTAGLPGDCTGTAGVLSYSEIQSRNQTLNADTFYDPVTTVKYTTFQGTQWVSYDDEQSFHDKKRFLSSHCLGGLMIWAIDQDTQDYQALSAILGEEAVQQSMLEGRSISADDQRTLSAALGAYNGQDCFVTKLCTDGSPDQLGPDQVCPSGMSSMATAHKPQQAPGHEIEGMCATGWFRHICCPSRHTPQNCKWNGTPERSATGCSGHCGTSQFELNSDAYYNDKGDRGMCSFGHRSLCCDGTELLEDSGPTADCIWTGCVGPIEEKDPGPCPGDRPVHITDRFDQDGGAWCAATFDDGEGSPTLRSFKRAYCCKKQAERDHCMWSNEIPYRKDRLPQPCLPSQCLDTQVKVTSAREPIAHFFDRHPDQILSRGRDEAGSADCTASRLAADTAPAYPLCCDPPTEFTEKWPVNPAYLWEHPYTDDDSDVMWAYADNYANNNKDDVPNIAGTDSNADEYGEDAYGFIMLDGPPSSLDNDFAQTFTVVRRQAELPLKKRSLLTTDQATLNATFDHAEETIHVFCNYPEESRKCQKIFAGGATDTIIKMPSHVGEGPFARVVHMKPATSDFIMPAHHVRARSAGSLSSSVWELKFDYNFHLIQRDDGDVNMRVDYTNLLGYWDEMTDTPAKAKRNGDHAMDYRQWRAKVDQAKETHRGLRKRSNDRRKKRENRVSTGLPLHKRWFGVFLDWLERLTTLTSQGIGTLDLGISKRFLLYEAATPCAKASVSAQMQLFMNTDISMEATYAYYLSGTFLPLSRAGVKDTFAYFGLDPSAGLELQVVGNARMQYTSDRKKLIDTLGYPGLSIKGIATIGPSLDIYGQIKGQITLSGEVKAGARLNFGRAEVYWPQQEDAAKYDELNALINDPEAPRRTELVPTFQANVEASADLRVIVTPEVSLGLVVGSDRFGGRIMDARIIGFVNSSLVFQADAGASYILGDGEVGWRYSYAVFVLFNVGYGATAGVFIKGIPDWNLATRLAYDQDLKFDIIPFTQVDSTPSDSRANSKRQVDPPRPLYAPRRGLLNSIDGTELTPIESPASSTKAHPKLLSSHSDSDNSSFVVDYDHLFGKRGAVNDGGGTSNLPQQQQITGAAQLLQCVSGDGIPQLPDYRVNCNLFPEATATGPNGQVNKHGMCWGMQNWFDKISMAHQDLQLTWDPKESRVDRRRSQSCPSKFCETERKGIEAVIGLTVNPEEFQCDEFPFASSEEGGNYMSNRFANKNPASTVCIPRWENGLQGNCNKLLSTLEQNVGTKQSPIWVPWKDDDSWFDSSKSWQGVEDKNAEIPLAPNIDADIYAQKKGKYGYTNRRAFTFGLSTPISPTNGDAWGDKKMTGWTTYGRGGVVSKTDVTEVACAINTFNQPSFIRHRTDANYYYNGLCYRGKGTEKQSVPWGNYPSYRRCRIDFDGNKWPSSPSSTSVSSSPPTSTLSSSSKRTVGQFGGWKITNIEIFDSDPEEIRVPDDHDPFADGEKGMPYALISAETEPELL